MSYDSSGKCLRCGQAVGTFAAHTCVVSPPSQQDSDRYMDNSVSRYCVECERLARLLADAEAERDRRAEHTIALVGSCIVRPIPGYDYASAACEQMIENATREITAERDRLRQFAEAVINVCEWGPTTGFDEEDVYDASIRHGVIVERPHAQPCTVEGCACEGEYTELCDFAWSSGPPNTEGGA